MRKLNEQSWKNRITRFFSAQAISLLGSSIVQFALVWYITLEHSSGKLMALAVICSFAPQILVNLFAGVVLDRFNRKYVIMISDSLIALATFLLFLAVRGGNTSLPLMFATIAIRSLGTGVQMPAVNAVIPQLVPEDKLMRINGIGMSMQSLIATLSPVVSAMVLGIAGLSATLLVDVVTAIIGVAITSRVFFPPLEQKDDTPTSSLDDMRAGLAYLMEHTFLKRLLVYFGVVLFLFAPVWMIYLVGERSFGGEYWRLASMESAYGLGAIIGGAFIAWWGGLENRMTTMLLASTILGGLMVMLGLVPFWPFVAILFAWGLANPTLDASYVTALQERVEPEMHGRVFSFIQIVVASSIPAGMLVFGPLADVISVQLIFVICGILIVGVSFFARYVLKLEHV